MLEIESLAPTPSVPPVASSHLVTISSTASTAGGAITVTPHLLPPSLPRTYGNLSLALDLNSRDGGGNVNNRRVLALTGGVRVAQDPTEPLLALFEATNSQTLTPLKLTNVLSSPSLTSVDVGAMVHASGAMVASDANSLDLLIVGGGTPAFAFRPQFSPSYKVTLRFDGVDASAAAALAAPAAPPPPPLNTSPLPPLTATCILTQPRNAKAVKTNLEKLGLLDKTFRIGKSSQDPSLMAIPVLPDFNSLKASDTAPDWLNHVSDNFSEETLPLNKTIQSQSTVSNGRPNAMPLLHQVVLQHDPNYDKERLPKSLERLGDDVIVVPAKTLTEEQFDNMFWETLATKHRAKRVARR